jgi:predicted nucleic acid-binding protein
METSPSPVLEGAGRAFADTSYFFALLNARDPDHAGAMRIAQQIAIGQVEVFTTWEVVSETATLLRYRWTHGAAAKFLTRLVPDLTVLQPDEDDRIAAIRLFLRKRDRKLSLCDAVSYVVVSTRLQWAPCLSFDADFRAMGLTVVR